MSLLRTYRTHALAVVAAVVIADRVAAWRRTSETRRVVRALDRMAQNRDGLFVGADVQRDGLTLAATASGIPPRYVPASWRNTTPIDPATGLFGLGFKTLDGDVFLRLDMKNGRQIAETYAEATQVHFAKSSGAPRSDDRSPDGTLKCEPTCASEAAERAS